MHLHLISLEAARDRGLKKYFTGAECINGHVYERYTKNAHAFCALGSHPFRAQMIPLRAKNACGLHCAKNIQVIPAAINNMKRNKMIFTTPFEWMSHP